MTHPNNLRTSLADLKAEFRSFKSKAAHPKAMVPIQLKEAILALVDKGISHKIIANELGLSESVICKWRANKPRNKKPSAPRILNVIDKEPAATTLPPGLRITYEAGRLVIEISLT